MALSLVAVGAKITAAITNAIIGVVNAQGLTSVIPTGVVGSGVSVGASGKVTFTGASSISVKGCFTSTYDNYLVIIDQDSATSPGAMTIQYTVAGTATVTGYDGEEITAINATPGATPVVNAASIAITNTTTLGVAELRVRSPFRAVATLCLADFFSTNNPGTAAALTKFNYGFSQRATTQFDGFLLTVSAGTATGSIRVYGFNNN